MNHPDLFTVPEAAAVCSVSRRTMLRWVDAGCLPHARTVGGHHRIERSDLVRFMREQSLPVPRELEPPGPRLMLVDDDATFLASFELRLLERLPQAQIRVATDGFAAGAMVASFVPHVLFLDLVMSGMSGEQVCRVVREGLGLPDVGIVITTGHPDRLIWADLRQMGADHLLRKPIDQAELNATLAAFVPGAAAGSRTGAPRRSS